MLTHEAERDGTLKLAWPTFFVCASLTGVTFPLLGGQARIEVVGFLVLLVAVLRMGWGRFVGATVSLPVAGFSVLYLSGLIIGTFWSPMGDGGNVSVLLRIVLSILVLVLSSHFVPNTRLLFESGNVVLGVLCVFSLVRLLSVLLRGSEPRWPGVAQDLRLVGFSFEPNIFAAQLVCWLSVLMAVRYSPKRYEKMLIGLMMVSVALAGTRSAWIVGILLLVLAVFQSGRRFQVAVLACLIGVLGVLLLKDEFMRLAGTSDTDSLAWRLANLTSTSSGTGRYRAAIFWNAVQDISVFPRWLIGSGANSYSYFHPFDVTSSSAEYLPNVVLATVYDGGLIALIGMLGLFLGVRFFARSARAWIVIASLLICSMATNVLWFQFAWAYVGVSSGSLRAGGVDDRLHEIKDRAGCSLE